MTVPMADRVCRHRVPDSPLTRDVTDFIRDAEDDLLFNHSRRVFFFGALQGRRRDFSPISSCSTSARCFTTSA